MTLQRALRRYSPSQLARLALQRSLGRLTGSLRTLPDFIIIGAQRCGTTSLYNYLAQHPQVLPATIKETHFYDNNFRRGLNWYRAFFPLARQTNGGRRLVTGESTPYYLFYPHAPARVYETLPDVKLIVMLRNPIDRAFSHYAHEKKMGAETMSFEEALDREERGLAAETARIVADENYRSFFHQHYTYLSRGIYVDQLARWTEFFRREQILIVESQDFYQDPAAALRQVTDFLGLPPWELEQYPQYNATGHGTMEPRTRERLAAYFRPHNRRLYDLMGVDWKWDRRR